MEPPFAAIGTTMVAVAVARWMLPAPHIDGSSGPLMYQRGFTLTPSSLKYPILSATANCEDIWRSRTSHASISVTSGFCAWAEAVMPKTITSAARILLIARPLSRLWSVNEAPLHTEQQRVDERAEQPQHEGAHHDLRRIAERPSLHDQVAEAGVGAHELGADDDEHRQAEAEPQRHDDTGQRGREHDPREEVRAARAERSEERRVGEECRSR